ncbi:hypothetical protein P168DRAFT_346806 [Aspergillus campestris IBT 28561]|uniref:Uncharacterized protein n=1 Tax=Aspergillus campestris (strain IBT 28561) TaxID=1392248 RepID=A0A2I1CZ26_ASPC2|nr:uncharacterized protein P168DRAFT_337692 [Aspergillus campestris IBT 28561]XP_024691483.1 uncharacterized protein P168DRAFT_346806 [Aspergillus campestris IBT 28561]PKX99840.1 hypothetical protein P168DRAFT_337692 [Aspergillus campestris IBT 28561]PKY02889.1 hypothetical protein P168DRAFT_346806 [Aspergillus campestris IBT 28561]
MDPLITQLVVIGCLLPVAIFHQTTYRLLQHDNLPLFFLQIILLYVVYFLASWSGINISYALETFCYRIGCRQIGNAILSLAKALTSNSDKEEQIKFNTQWHRHITGTMATKQYGLRLLERKADIEARIDAHGPSSKKVQETIQELEASLDDVLPALWILAQEADQFTVVVAANPYFGHTAHVNREYNSKDAKVNRNLPTLKDFGPWVRAFYYELQRDTEDHDREECARRMGCCARDCGCCQEVRRAAKRRDDAYDSTREILTHKGHCTVDCGCCVRWRGFTKPVGSGGSALKERLIKNVD